jgi:glutamine amidotransferase
MGGLTPENTHPFCLGSYSFSHNGTIMDFTRLRDRGVPAPHGTTDSEYFFNFLMHDFDDGRVVDCLRHTVLTTVARSPFSGVNFLFCDGERLYAYRLGMFELHWMSRPGQLLVSSEVITQDERWHSVQQDVLLTLDPRDPEEPHAERLIGDAAMARARIEQFDDGSHLRGTARGHFAEQRAAEVASPATE